MKNKKKNKKKIKRTPEQKRMLWKKQQEKMKQNNQLRKDLENQKKLERERIINETKEKMEKEKVDGMYYHITTLDKADMIMDSSLRCGSRSNVANEKRLLDSKGKIYFIDSDNERLWNGVVCDVLDDRINENHVEKHFKTQSDELLDYDKYPQHHPSNFSSTREMMHQLGIELGSRERDDYYNREYVCIGVPKSYFIVNQLEKKTDKFLDVTNGFEKQIYFETQSIDNEFLEVNKIFKPDYYDWEMEYRWEICHHYMSSIMIENMKDGILEEPPEYIKKELEESVGGDLSDEDWKQFYEQIIMTIHKDGNTWEHDGVVLDRWVWCNRWAKQIDYGERFKYNSDTYWNKGGDIKDSEWMRKFIHECAKNNPVSHLDEKPENIYGYELKRAS